jgi:hypothetical protein
MKRFGWALLAAACACGGAAAPEASSPASDVTPTVTTPEASHSTAPPVPEVATARGELDRAEGQLSAVQGDCASACRALASMERAAEHICALDSGNECGRARERVDSARERVRATCGTCAP